MGFCTTMRCREVLKDSGGIPEVPAIYVVEVHVRAAERDHIRGQGLAVLVHVLLVVGDRPVEVRGADAPVGFELGSLAVQYVFILQNVQPPHSFSLLPLQLLYIERGY
eukprot:scaffold87906_cov36-Prasinocladus_malaysianus.AAC.1